MKEKEYSRRQFINQCAERGTALLGMTFLLNSCGGSNKDKRVAEEGNSDKPADPCNDFTG